MLAEKKTNTNIGVGVGILLQLVSGMMGPLGGLFLIVGLAVFIWGCANYAQGKGYSGWLGLLGLASLIGLIVLVVFSVSVEVRYGEVS